MVSTEQSDPDPNSGRAPSRGRWRLAVTLVVVLALGALLRALLPLGLERALESRLAAELGRPVRVANVDLALLRGGILLEGVVIGAPGAAEPAQHEGADEALLRAERLLVRAAWTELARGRVHLREIALDGAALRLARTEDGSLEPLAVDTAPAAQAEDEPGAPGWPLRVDRIVVREGRLRVTDPAAEVAPLDLRLPRVELEDLAQEPEGWTLGSAEARTPTLRLHRDGSAAAGDDAPAADAPGPDRPAVALRAGRLAIEDGRVLLLGPDEPLEVKLTFSASEVSTRSEARFPIDLALGVGEGRAELKGSAGVLPLAFQGRLELRDLPLAPLVHAAAGPAGQPLRAGRASGELDLTAEPAEGASDRWLRASGRVAVDALAVADRASGSFGLGWKRLEATLAEARLPLGGGGAARLDLERLRLELPSLRWVRTPPAPTAEEAGESEGTTSPLQVSIAELELVDGSLDFEDRSVEPAFRARAEQVAATARGVAWPAGRAEELRVSGQVLERGSLALEGGLGAETGKLELELAGVGLPPLNPYITRTGYRFGAGRASLRSELKLQGTRIEASNQLLVHDLDVESSGDGWLEENLGLSLGLTIALLRDHTGAIRLAVPLTWKAGAGGAGFGRAFQSALRQALVGAVSTPLKLVGATFSVRGEEVVRFEALGGVAGEVTLTESGEARLASLLALLETRPRLGVRLRGRSGPSDDAALAGSGEAVPAGPREALARARAERIAERLAERGIEARRIELGSPAPAGAPGVDVEFFALAS